MIKNSYTCICCRKNKIKLLEGIYWENGAVEKISFGYGSRNDSRCFYLAICDDCIERAEKDGLVIDTEVFKNVIKKG